MQELLIYFFVAIGLSMDAFSLALVLGINNIAKIKIVTISIVVGSFHLFMPIIGANLGIVFLSNIMHKSNNIVGAILIIIAVQMYLSRKETESVKVDNFIAILIFAFTVSLDSLSVGIGYGLTEVSILIPGIIFSLTSFFFTFIGLSLGNKIYTKYKTKSTYLGIVILIFTAIRYFFE